MPPLDKLRNRELGLLAMLMYYNYLYRSIEEPIRLRIINDTATRREICQLLNMSDYIYNNNIHILKKAGVIDSSCKVAKFLQIPSDDMFSIGFNFNIENNEQ
jgi:hypothetical protein